MGILFGAGLAVASRLLAVKKDKLVAGLEEALPGLNCGACGYAGCSSYAEAIARNGKTEEDDVPLTLCLPGGEETAMHLAELMSVELTYSAVKKVAQVHCRGSRQLTKHHYDYIGVKDCNALFALYGGDKECPYGCLGLGSCIKVCPVDAIEYDGEGLVWVTKDRCIACGKCIEVCPTGVMKFVPFDADYLVACSSNDKGRAVKNYCSVGCIGCKICEKKSPEGGFKVENFLARIEYPSDGGEAGERETAAEACPTHCIILNKSIEEGK